MGYNSRGEAVKADYNELNTKIVFRKSGKEIKASIEKRIVTQANKVEELQGKMAVICKNREVDLQEVLDAEDDHHRIENYSNKMSSSLGGTQTRVVLEKLQEDINFLRSASNTVAYLRRMVGHLERVSRNIEEDSTNTLTYDELIVFGF